MLREDAADMAASRKLELVLGRNGTSRSKRVWQTGAKEMKGFFSPHDFLHESDDHENFPRIAG
jgi:hypothetical protein